MTSATSSVQRRRLREVLRHLREEADLTQEQVANETDWSLSKVIRIETGAVRISVTDLRALLDLYRVTDPERAGELLDLARGARKRSWLTPYKSILSTGFVTYAELEADAREVRYFNTTLLPGIMQTEAYATAASRMSMTGQTAKVGMAVEVRLRRQQEIFEQDRPPQFIVVLDEAVLRREVGGPEVLGEQLRYLLDLAARPYIRLLVIPFARGAHAGNFGPFILMDFPDPEDKPLLFREGPFRDSAIRDKSDTIAVYRRAFDSLVDSALSEEASRAFIQRIADALR